MRPTPVVPLDDKPDELMIAWGNVPAGTHASIYLPTVDAAAALDWAQRMYVSNRLTLVDAHTLSCEAGGVTFVPVPGASDLDHVGLMSVELPPTVHKGERYSVRVRQLTGARFGAGRQVELGTNLTNRKGDVNEVIGAPPEVVLRSFEAASREGFPLSTHDRCLRPGDSSEHQGGDARRGRAHPVDPSLHRAIRAAGDEVVAGVPTLRRCPVRRAGRRHGR